VFTSGQVIKKRQIFRNHSDHSLGFQRLVWIPHSLSENQDFTVGWREQTGKHFDGCGLSSAVGTKESVKRSAFHMKFDAIDRAQFTKVPSQLSGFDRKAHSLIDTLHAKADPVATAPGSDRVAAMSEPGAVATGFPAI